jgi:hypothetical protein
VNADPAGLAAALRAALAAHGRGALAEAAEELDRAARIAPAHPDLLHLRGLVAMGRGAASEAIAWLARATEAAPATALYWNNLGYARREAGDLDGAAQALMRAIALQPGYASAHNNLGATLAARALYAEAARCFDAAIGFSPGQGAEHDDARLNRARAMLCMGRLAAGWDDHRFRPTRIGLPQDWRLPAGAAGLGLALAGEQGVGDQLFFLRFAPIAAARGALPRFDGDARLAGIAARGGVAQATGGEERTIAIGDLPWVLGCGDADIPPPLRIDPLPDAMRRVASLLAPLPRPLVGVAWRAGGVAGAHDTTKQVPPARLGAALRGARGTFVGIQRHPRPGELAAFSAGAGRPAVDLSAANDDLEMLLAVVASLDFLAGVSSTSVHLRCSAGLGSDVLVPFPMDWRWRGEEGGDVPWYPGCRAYRQGQDGGWDRQLAALGASMVARAR